VNDLTPEAERTALDDMLRSDGWRVFMDHMSAAWGAEAMERALRESRAKVSPEEWPFESARILDTFAGMRANFRWPAERVKALKDPPKPAIVDRFAGLRRGPRS
jgi:hypothetical protein